MGKENKDLAKQLKVLNQNIETLTKVTAVSIGKEAIFKGKDTIEEKVDILVKMGLPNEIIAIITGSKSSHSISQIKSKMHPARRIDEQIELKEENTEKGDKLKDEQSTD